MAKCTRRLSAHWHNNARAGQFRPSARIGIPISFPRSGNNLRSDEFSESIWPPSSDARIDPWMARPIDRLTVDICCDAEKHTKHKDHKGTDSEKQAK